MSFFKRLLRSALVAPFLIATANAVIQDWNTVSWTAGSLSNSYDVAIQSFAFTYGSGSNPGADPAYQHVGIDGSSLSPIPEVNSAWSAVGSCLIAAALILRHSAKFWK